jgi:riboflavin kinase / FMN adenylyltransferase
VRIFNSISEFESYCRPVATVGVFDGVHRGHQQIIQMLTNSAKEKNCESVVVTFEPHPRLVVGNATEVRLLQGIDEKIERFRSLGVDSLLIIPFDKDFAEMEPADFIKLVMVDTIKASKVITGYDHFFGRGRLGDFTLLEESGKQNDFDVVQVSPVNYCNQTVSSSLIRNALLEGNIELANCMLGYQYSIRGKVVRGNQIGKLIGFPTANIQLSDPIKLIPAHGVYASLVKWNGNMYKGMSNIGLRPTIDANRLTVEVNIFDFEEDIYSEPITLYFLEKIREEKKFGGLEQLKDQLSQDKETVKRIFENRGNQE